MIYIMFAFSLLIFLLIPESFAAGFDARPQSNFPYSELISAIIGALLGALAAARLYRKESKRQTKIDTVKRLVSNRFDLTGAEFTQVVNEVLVIFADSEKTIRALDNFRQKRSDENLIQLWREMSDAAKIPHDHISDDLFLTAFNVRT